jgi:hypothetical protein
VLEFVLVVVLNCVVLFDVVLEYVEFSIGVVVVLLVVLVILLTVVVFVLLVFVVELVVILDVVLVVLVVVLVVIFFVVLLVLLLVWFELLELGGGITRTKLTLSISGLYWNCDNASKSL